MPEIHIDLNEMTAACASVLYQPYVDFLSRLHADGRITDAEIQGLNNELENRIPRLAELVQARLAESGRSTDR